MVYKKKIKIYSGYLKKNLDELFLVIFLNITLLVVNYFSLCTGYLRFSDFDFQTFLTWNYSASNNFIPYRDLYYPYGLLPYFRDGNTLFLILYLIFSLLVLNTLIFFFRKIFKLKQITYIIFVPFLFFIIFIANTGTFNRYGISLAISTVLSYCFYANRDSSRFYFLSGFILSIIFWLFHDQGIFGFIIFFLFQFVEVLSNFRKVKTKLFLRPIFIRLSYFVFGSFLGLLPFVYYLTKNNALEMFWYYLTVSLPEFPLLSKTPLFNLFISLNNLFSVGVLSFAILFITYKFVQKRKKSLYTYFEIGLIFTIILLEQKNIVRLMENNISFIAFVLFAIIFWEIITQSKKRLENNTLIRITCLIVVMLIIGIFYLAYGNNSGITKSNFSNPTRKNCHNLNMGSVANSDEYKLVIQKLMKYENFNNKILSYPGDPIFYVLLKQKQPYFTSIYEASSKTSQIMNINYLKNNINYVVVNTRNKAIQDEVPNYIRGVYELKYILGNYSVKDSAGNFLILERHQNSDFFLNNNYKLASEYKKHLLDINLESIPLSEGRNKERYIINADNKFLTKDFNQKKINKYLENNNVSSDKIILLVNSGNVTDDYFTLKIITKDNRTTNIKMKSCKESYCVINLSNVPLFYNLRQIKNFEFNDKILVSILKVSDGNIERLW